MNIRRKNERGIPHRSFTGKRMMKLWLVLVVVTAALATVGQASEGRDARERGRALLEQRKYAEARQAFIEAISANAHDVYALHGLALCQYGENRIEEAAQTLRQAVQLSGEKPETALIVNLAAVEVELGQPMVAVQLCADHLQRLGKAPEETILDALGIALVAAQAEHGTTPEFQQGGATYMRTVAILESSRPGMKRWGTEWISAAEYEERLASGPPIFPPGIDMLSLGDPPAVVEVVAQAEPQRPRLPAPQRQRAAAPARLESALAIPVAPHLLIAPSDAIGDARATQLESTQGTLIKATVVHVDKARKLALLKTEMRMTFFNLGEDLEEGPAQSAVIPRPVVFNLAPEMVEGEVRRQDERWIAQLKQRPHLVGSPMIREGRLVGVAISPANDASQVELVPAREIRELLGRNLPAPTRVVADPQTAIYLVKAQR